MGDETQGDTTLIGWDAAPGAQWGNVSAPGARRASFVTCAPLLLICWATLYGFAPEPPGHQQMFLFGMGMDLLVPGVISLILKLGAMMVLIKGEP